MTDQQSGGPRSLADVFTEEMRALGDEVPAAAQGGDHAARLRAMFRELHRRTRKRAALCFSGGGIRSATFGLGVLQGLARARLLGSFDFLSTVSGGGYLGSWLSAWIKHSGRDRVLQMLAQPPGDEPLDPEWKQLRFLRSYSNYLAPRLSLLSADTWTLVATFLRNMLLNWLVIFPTMIAGLFLTRVFMSAVLTTFPPGAEWVAWSCASILMALSIAYEVFDLPGPERPTATAAAAESREKRNESLFVWLRITPLVLSASLFVLGWAWRYNGQPLVEFPALIPILPGASWIAPDIATLRIDGAGVRVPLAAPPGTALAAFFGAPIILGWLGGWSVRRYRNAKRGEVETAPAAHPHRRWREPVVVGSSVICALLAARVIQWLAGGAFSRPTSHESVLYLVCFAPPLLLSLFLVFNYLVSGMSSRVTDDEEREWWGRASGWLLAAILGIAAQGTIVYWGIYWLEHLEAALKSEKAVTAALGSFGGLAGTIAAIIGFSTQTAARAKESPAFRQLVLMGSAIAFLVLMEVLLAYGTHLLAGRAYPVLYVPGFFALSAEQQQWFLQPWLLLLIPMAIGLLASATINVNRFSLHTMYRSRLVRAYLGASNPDRRPHAFTGFDPHDNPRMADLSAERPLHVVNIALNLVATEDLAWQERKAQSFTVTRLHAGSWNIDYQPSATYGERISLGTAMTISGAAANPNAGYHSSPLVTLLMTLFNVRLGWWLANPGEKGRGAWHWSGPKWALGPLCAEALGLTNRRFKYVNLSDGGHFENLGIYEMVLRRCHRIVAVDGGQDTAYAFEDLGNAIRKIRIDFGISIDIKVKFVSPQTAGDKLAYCAFGLINYGDIDKDDAGQPVAPGYLVYIKPVLTGDEPADVANYKAAHPDFPHESTGDQFFSESQLESYRMLGCHAFGQIAGAGAEFGSLDAFFRRVDQYTERSLWPAILAEGDVGPDRRDKDQADERVALKEGAVDRGNV